jgi:hypothetical protein
MNWCYGGGGSDTPASLEHFLCFTRDVTAQFGGPIAVSTSIPLLSQISDPNSRSWPTRKLTIAAADDELHPARRSGAGLGRHQQSPAARHQSMTVPRHHHSGRGGHHLDSGALDGVRNNRAGLAPAGGLLRGGDSGLLTETLAEYLLEGRVLGDFSFPVFLKKNQKMVRG